MERAVGPVGRPGGYAARMFVFLPIGDEPNDHVRRPVVTWGLIALNLVIAAAVAWSRTDLEAFAERFGYHPAKGDPLTLLTHQFVHAGWLHVVGNMLFLWIFGDNVESRLGHLGFLVAYLATGAAAGWIQGALDGADGRVLVGASGAVSGVEGLYFVACPGARVRLFVWMLYFVRVVLVPARAIMVVWFLLQDVLPVVAQGRRGGDGVGHWAHLGGFAAGLVVMLALLPLLGRNEAPVRASLNDRYRRRGQSLD